MTDHPGASAPLSPAALEARYAAERDKRLRADGVGQYRELTGVFADFDRDPYADPNFTREPVNEEIDVAIIGGGLGGLMAAARLAEQGITRIRIVDRAGDFGGTWYWNRYPGAACDVESYIYLPFLEETGYMPVEKYSKAPEIFAHCQRIGEHFGLYPKALFQTQVEDLSWDDQASRWRVVTDRGDRLTARFAIVAGGVLHKAKLPGIPGMETFKGHAFHTSRWDYGYTGGGPDTPMDKLRDRRVALIGTGATAIQVVPQVAQAAKALYVFQRTPSAVGVRGNQPTDPAWAKSLKPGWQRERSENFTRIVSGKPAKVDLVQDGWTEIFTRNPAAWSDHNEEQQLIDYQVMEELRARIDATVSDPATAEALKPWYNRMCKRPCFHDEFLQAFNKPNVTLVDTRGKGVERVTEQGLVFDGVEYPVDCIIYGSGFETSSSYKSRLGFEIHGRDGVALSEAWADGAATLYGMHARGFPNLIMFSLTQGGFAINFSHLLGELALHTAWFIRRCLDDRIEEVEPTPQAQEAWFNTLLANVGTMASFMASCTPSYMNGEGGRSVNAAALRALPFFGGTLEFIQILRDWRTAGDLAGLETRRVEEVVK